MISPNRQNKSSPVAKLQGNRGDEWLNKEHDDYRRDAGKDGGVERVANRFRAAPLSCQGVPIHNGGCGGGCARNVS